MFFNVKLPDIPGLPPLEALLDALSASLVFFCLAAMAFGPLIAVSSEAFGKARRRVFLVKAARQYAGMSLFFTLVAFLAMGAFVYWLLTDEPLLFSGSLGVPLIALCAMGTAALVLQLLYAGSWKKNGTPGFAHTLCGFLAWLVSCAALYTYQLFSFRYFEFPSLFSPAGTAAEPGTDLATGLATNLADLPAESLGGAATSVTDLAGSATDAAAQGSKGIFSFTQTPAFRELADFFCSVPRESFFWPQILHMAFLAIGIAGALSAFWLLIWRQRNDFGRDYYAFALPHSAKWGIAGTLVSLATAFYAYSRAGEFMLPELSEPPALALAALCYALPALACILWGLLLQSATPLRHKPGIVTALLTLFAGVAAQFLVLNEIVPSP